MLIHIQDEAITLSTQIVAVAMLIAMVLATLALAALYRRKLFGKQGISLMVILPIALPGMFTIIIGNERNAPRWAEAIGLR